MQREIKTSFSKTIKKENIHLIYYFTGTVQFYLGPSINKEIKNCKSLYMVKSQNVKMEIQRTQLSETCTIHGHTFHLCLNEVLIESHSHYFANFAMSWFCIWVRKLGTQKRVFWVELFLYFLNAFHSSWAEWFQGENCILLSMYLKSYLSDPKIKLCPVVLERGLKSCQGGIALDFDKLESQIFKDALW